MTTLTMAQPQPQARREPDERTVVLPPGYVRPERPRFVVDVDPESKRGRIVLVGDRPNPERGRRTPPPTRGPVADFAAKMRLRAQAAVARAARTTRLDQRSSSMAAPTSAQVLTWRSEKELSQREVAALVGISKGTLQKAEKPREGYSAGSPELLRRIGEALGHTAAEWGGA